MYDAEQVGSYAHVLGCVENDVNSQLTKVLSVGGSAAKPTLAIEFRNSFNVAQVLRSLSLPPPPPSLSLSVGLPLFLSLFLSPSLSILSF